MNAPDRNAPRYKMPYVDLLNGPKFVRRFKEKYPQYSQYSDEVLISAIKSHNKLIANEPVINRDGIELPSGLGYLFIGMINQKIKKPLIAWDKSIKLGMLVYHKNWQTDGKLGKIYYVNYGTKYQFAGRHLWCFSAVRAFSKSASDAMIKNWQMYMVSDNNIRMWRNFKNLAYKGMKNRKREVLLKKYDEFQLD